MTKQPRPPWSWWFLGLGTGMGIANALAHPQAVLNARAAVTAFTTDHAIPTAITYGPIALIVLATVLLPVFGFSKRKGAAGISTLVVASAIITISISPTSLLSEALNRLYPRKLPKEELP